MATVKDYLNALMEEATRIREIYANLDGLDDEVLDGNLLKQAEDLLDDLLDIIDDQRDPI